MSGSGVFNIKDCWLKSLSYKFEGTVVLLDVCEILISRLKWFLNYFQKGQFEFFLDFYRNMFEN